MSNLVLGVDPGVGGAIAVIDASTGRLIEIHDMPSLADGSGGRRAVNAPLLAALIYKTHATAAYVELVTAMPHDGSVGAFSFGRTRGIIEGVLGAVGIPVEMIAPTKWKRAAGIAPGKENKDSARSIAISKWPDKAGLFARKSDVDRAEAALIGLAGLKREASL